MPCVHRGSINACGKADAHRLCWYQIWDGSWASPCRDGGWGSDQSHQLFPSVSLMQFRGLEGPAHQTGRCQLGGQVDGAAQAEGSAATHGWMATKPCLPLTQTPLADCILQHLWHIRLGSCCCGHSSCGSLPKGPGQSDLEVSAGGPGLGVELLPGTSA